MFAKKSLGQNFLNSTPALHKMVAAADVQKSDIVLEVGPGKGALTRVLLETGAHVIAVEKDDRLIPILQETFKRQIDDGQFVLHHGDILTTDPAELGLKEHQFKIIANIPYYITGQFFKKFFSESLQPSVLVVLVQKEVAERIMARDGKESVLSLSVKVYGKPLYIGTVLRGSFFPAPNVDSAILAVTDITRKNLTDVSEKRFFEVIKAGFAHKRKQLLGNLKAFGNEKIAQLFEKQKLPLDCRAEDLKLEDWLVLTSSLKDQG